jgi:putative sigma-54 modulation protein
MNIKIMAHRFDADIKLEDFIQHKVSKLSQFADDIIGAEVFLSLERQHAKNIDSKVTKIKLQIPGSELFAEKHAGSFEEATDSAVDAIRRQIRKRNTKIKE